MNINNCKGKDLLYLQKYKNFFKKDEDNIDKMCLILSNYLEPNTLRVVRVLSNTYVKNVKSLKELFEKNNFVVRCDTFTDNSDILFDYLFTIMQSTKSKYIAYELNEKGVFISLKKIGSDLMYDFVRMWSINYIYVGNITIPVGLYTELKTTVTEDKYTCYRGMSFSKKNLIKFFEKLSEKKGIKKVSFDKFSSWTTDVNTAKSFAYRYPIYEEHEKAYQVVLATIVKKNDVLAVLDKIDPIYDQNEIILHPGTYNIKLFIYDSKKKEFIDRTDIWDTYASID